jgi:hypothetical protein
MERRQTFNRMKAPRGRFGRLLLGLLALAAAACQSAAPLSRIAVEALPHHEAMFERRSGWTGGDGVFSTPLGPERLLWLFGDTFIGEVAGGRHVNATLVNNTIGLQSGKRPPDAVVAFFHGRGEDGGPAAFVRPADGMGWFWPYHGILTEAGLFLFLIQIERTHDPLAFGFRLVATWLGHVENPHAPPESWTVAQRKLPWGGAERLFGSALLRSDGEVYIYGTVDETAGGLLRKDVILARAPAAALGDFSRWRFWSAEGWSAEADRAEPVCRDAANEFSVSFQPALGRFVMVYTRGSLSADIVLRHAPAPEGPWSEPVWLYRCPEAEWDARIFCYAAKGHPALSEAGDLVVTYTTNSADFDLVLNDARLYRPRFLRVRFGP